MRKDSMTRSISWAMAGQRWFLAKIKKQKEEIARSKAEKLKR
jgi:hypothetical protein